MKTESVILKYTKYIICLTIILFSGITQAAHRTAEQALAIARQHVTTSSDNLYTNNNKIMQIK